VQYAICEVRQTLLKRVRWGWWPDSEPRTMRMRLAKNRRLRGLRSMRRSKAQLPPRHTALIGAFQSQNGGPFVLTWTPPRPKRTIAIGHNPLRRNWFLGWQLPTSYGWCRIKERPSLHDRRGPEVGMEEVSPRRQWYALTTERWLFPQWCKLGQTYVWLSVDLPSDFLFLVSDLGRSFPRFAARSNWRFAAFFRMRRI